MAKRHHFLWGDLTKTHSSNVLLSDFAGWVQRIVFFGKDNQPGSGYIELDLSHQEYLKGRDFAEHIFAVFGPVRKLSFAKYTKYRFTAKISSAKFKLFKPRNHDNFCFDFY